MPAQPLTALDCRTLNDGTPCVLGSERRRDLNCSVCRSLRSWRDAGFTTAFVKETGPETAYVFPAIGDGESDRCILRMDLVNTTDAELRRTVNTVVSSIGTVWLYDHSTRQCRLLSAPDDGE